jgi:hypothetical protein
MVNEPTDPSVTIDTASLLTSSAENKKAPQPVVAELPKEIV